MSDEIKEITRRITLLEGRMARLSRVVAAVTGWFSRGRKANAVSRHLSGPEVIGLRDQMRGHGVDDSSGYRKKVKA